MHVDRCPGMIVLPVTSIRLALAGTCTAPTGRRRRCGCLRRAPSRSRSRLACRQSARLQARHRDDARADEGDRAGGLVTLRREADGTPLASGSVRTVRAAAADCAAGARTRTCRRRRARTARARAPSAAVGCQRTSAGRSRHRARRAAPGRPGWRSDIDRPAGARERGDVGPEALLERHPPAVGRDGDTAWRCRCGRARSRRGRAAANRRRRPTLSSVELLVAHLGDVDPRACVIELRVVPPSRTSTRLAAGRRDDVHARILAEVRPAHLVAADLPEDDP